MKLKVFTFRFSESVDGFDDEPLQRFISNKEVIDSTAHFFIHDKTPYLTILISYRDLSHEERQTRDRTQDPRSDLDEKEKEAYDSLRAWRSARASQEGIPPYMIANNRQLAQMVRFKAQTKTDLERVSGIGEAKIARYGEDILKTLGRHFGHDPADHAQTDEEQRK